MTSLAPPFDQDIAQHTEVLRGGGIQHRPCRGADEAQQWRQTEDIDAKPEQHLHARDPEKPEQDQETDDRGVAQNAARGGHFGNRPPPCRIDSQSKNNKPQDRGGEFADVCGEGKRPHHIEDSP